jgi:hypothetical protein
MALGIIVLSGFVGGQAERQLRSGGMAHDDETIGIKIEMRPLLENKSIGRADVFERSRPSAAGVANTPVLDVEGGESRHAQRFAELTGMAEIVFGPPVAAVNIQ